MRIGILTLPLHTNYGGILQAYALQEVLRRMGHEVVTIDKPQYKPIKFYKYPFVYLKRIIKKYILNKKNIYIFQEIYPTITQYTQPFLDKYIQRLVISNLKKLKEKDFDAIIVGSDQIWRPLYYKNIEDAYLDFTEGWKIRRIAYAPSFGVDKWEYTYEQTEKCTLLLQKFDAVSIREDSGIKLCHEHLHIQAKQMLDPTMLLSKDDYIHLFKVANTPKSNGSLLCYVLDETEEKDALIRQIAEKSKLVPFRVNSRVEDKNAPLKERIQPPVEIWLRGFYDAELIVTDSFHACVFSILFEKPFIIIDNPQRGSSRIKSLLRMIGEKEHPIRDLSDIKNFCPQYIPFTAYTELRNESFKFLRTSLEN